MQTQFFEMDFATEKVIQIIDITEQVQMHVEKSAVANGLCVVHAPHATAAIIMNEAEPGLISDIERKIKDMFAGTYEHDKIDDNASAHIASAFLKSSVMLPIRDGHIIRGTWQNILFIELDGPRHSRKVIIEVIGDSI